MVGAAPSRFPRGRDVFRRTLCAPLALSLAWLCGPACGGATFRSGVYDGDEVRYRLAAALPGLERVDLSDYDVAFRLGEHGTIGISSRCHGYEDVPPRALMGHLLFGTTDRKRVLEETVTVDGRGALHVVEEVALDGVPVSLDLFVLPKDGCLFDFMFVSGRPAPAAATGTFRRLVESFELLAVKSGA